MFNAEPGVLCRHRFLEIAQTASGKAGRHEKYADSAAIICAGKLNKKPMVKRKAAFDSGACR